MINAEFRMQNNSKCMYFVFFLFIAVFCHVHLFQSWRFPSVTLKSLQHNRLKVSVQCLLLLVIQNNIIYINLAVWVPASQT